MAMLKRIARSLLLSATASSMLAAAGPTLADCLAAEQLKQLDYRYEQALRTGDEQFLKELLADQFVWIHNHAVAFETREALIERMGEGYEELKAREQQDVVVRRLKDTAVIHGMTTVDKFTNNDSRHANRYQFIRTYVKTPEGCRLLAGQTMKVWSTSEPLK